MSKAERMLAHARARGDELAAPHLTASPRLGVAVLACMDARMDLFAMLGLEVGDAHIVRNAGGLATDDAIRSLSVSQRLLGTEEIVVVMHEGCGLQGASEEDFAAMLAAAGAQPGWRLGAFEDLDQTLRESLARLRSAAELPRRDRIRGMIYSPASGTLRDVEATPASGATAS